MHSGKSADKTGEDNMSVTKWGIWEQAFAAHDQPPPDTELNVSVVSPTGSTKIVPGFWDGGRTWRVRLRPDEVGIWAYTTAASDPECGLHGTAGTFACTELHGRSNPFLEHGPVHLSDSGTHLSHHDGTPFFFLGDTVWNGAMLSTDSDWDTYLADRLAKNFSAVQFVTQAPWIGAFSNAEGEVAVSGNASMPVNPHFFQRMDARMDAINDRGLLAVPVLAWAATWNDNARRFNVGCFLPEDQLIAFVKYQVARYQAHHVLWILPGDGKYEGEEAEKWLRVGQAVFGDGGHAPVSLHPCGCHWPYEPFRDAAWCNVHGYQSSHNDHNNTIDWIQQGAPSKAWRSGPSRPVMNIEPCYEDHIAGTTQIAFNAYKVRVACYWSMLSAPPAGLTYGAHGMWAWHDREEIPLHHPRTGPGKPWKEAKDLPGATCMQHLVDCFGSVDWWRLRPDQELLVEQPGADDPNLWVAACRTEEGDQAIVYLPKGGCIRMRIAKLQDGCTGFWFDPRTGNMTEAEIAEGCAEAPDGQDWTLVLRT